MLIYNCMGCRTRRHISVKPLRKFNEIICNLQIGSIVYHLFDHWTAMDLHRVIVIFRFHREDHPVNLKFTTWHFDCISKLDLLKIRVFREGFRTQFRFRFTPSLQGFFIRYTKDKYFKNICDNKEMERL